MSSFYGNGGYSSGGGGSSGEVISVNGKKGQVTLNAADVHALPDTTQIPSLEGFATETWVQGQGYITEEKTPTHIVNGSASGSVRGINTKLENSSYKMGNNAWAEGLNTMASGKSSHAEGISTTASGDYSHAEGVGTIASKNGQFALGTYNIEDNSTTAVLPLGDVKLGQYAVIVGNGYNDTTNKEIIRSNAHTLDWQGNGWYAGKLTVGSAPTASMDVATKQYVDSAMSNYALKSEIPTVTNDFTDGYKDKVDSLWEDYQDALTALG